MMWYTPFVVVGCVVFLVLLVWLRSKAILLSSKVISHLLVKIKVSNLRLLSAIFLSVGVTLLFVALGVMTDIHGASVPSWFLIISPCTLMSISFFTKNEEDMALLPFAGAGALISFGRGITIGVGYILLMFALVRFRQIKESSKIPDRLTRPVWIYWCLASVVCLLVPPSVTYLSFVLFSALPTSTIPAICGLIIFWMGILVAFHLSKVEKK